MPNAWTAVAVVVVSVTVLAQPSGNRIVEIHDIGRKWTVRTHAGGHGGVIDDAVFQALIRQPIAPQQ